MILLPNCTCCGCSEECCRTRSYYYDDTVPPGKWWDECPGIGNCDEGAGAELGDCAGEVIEGHIVERFCKASIEGKEVRAYLRENSAIDDFGTIAGIDTTQVCGVLGIIEADHDITAEVEWEDDGLYMLAKVPIRMENSQLGGPLGAAGVVICWCCIDPEDPPPEGEICPCCAGPPPPPPDACCCGPTSDETPRPPGWGGIPYPNENCAGEGVVVIEGDSCWLGFDLSIVSSWCGVEISATLDDWPASSAWTPSPSPSWFASRTIEGDNCTRDLVINPPDAETCVLRDVLVSLLVLPEAVEVRCDSSHIAVSIVGYLQTYTGGFTYRVSDNLYLGAAPPVIKSYRFFYNGLTGSLTLDPDPDNSTTGENWCGNAGHYVCDEDDPVLTFTATRTTPPAP
jgi:hypothetical protein